MKLGQANGVGRHSARFLLAEDVDDLDVTNDVWVRGYQVTQLYEITRGALNESNQTTTNPGT